MKSWTILLSLFALQTICYELSLASILHARKKPEALKENEELLFDSDRMLFNIFEKRVKTYSHIDLKYKMDNLKNTPNEFKNICVQKIKENGCSGLLYIGNEGWEAKSPKEKAEMTSTLYKLFEDAVHEYIEWLKNRVSKTKFIDYEEMVDKIEDIAQYDVLGYFAHIAAERTQAEEQLISDISKTSKTYSIAVYRERTESWYNKKRPHTQHQTAALGTKAMKG